MSLFNNATNIVNGTLRGNSLSAATLPQVLQSATPTFRNITQKILNTFNGFLRNRNITHNTTTVEINLALGDPIVNYLPQIDLNTFLTKAIRLCVVCILLILIMNIINEICLRLDKDKEIMKNPITWLRTKYKESKYILPTTQPKKSKESPFIGPEVTVKTIIPKCEQLDNLEKGHNIMISHTIPYRRSPSSETFENQTRVTTVTVIDSTTGRPPLHPVKI